MRTWEAARLLSSAAALWLAPQWDASHVREHCKPHASPLLLMLLSCCWGDSRNRNAWQKPQPPILCLCISIEKKISLECSLHISKLISFTIAFFHPLVSDLLNFMIRLKLAFQKQCVYVICCIWKAGVLKPIWIFWANPCFEMQMNLQCLHSLR